MAASLPDRLLLGYTFANRSVVCLANTERKGMEMVLPLHFGAWHFEGQPATLGYEEGPLAVFRRVLTR